MVFSTFDALSSTLTVHCWRMSISDQKSTWKIWIIIQIYHPNLSQVKNMYTTPFPMGHLWSYHLRFLVFEGPEVLWLSETCGSACRSGSQRHISGNPFDGRICVWCDVASLSLQMTYATPDGFLDCALHTERFLISRASVCSVLRPGAHVPNLLCIFHHVSRLNEQ